MDPKRIIGKKWWAKEEEMHKELPTQKSAALKRMLFIFSIKSCHPKPP
jgi:hypothetical protein